MHAGVRDKEAVKTMQRLIDLSNSLRQKTGRDACCQCLTLLLLATQDGKLFALDHDMNIVTRFYLLRSRQLDSDFCVSEELMLIRSCHAMLAYSAQPTERDVA